MKYKILIVEDDNDINSLLYEILTKEDYLVTQSYSGTEAQLYLNQDSFNLVLLDLMLPGLSGNELLNKIRLNSNLPVIIISAKNNQKEKVKLLTLGADDYITKPFDIDEVLARIKNILKRSSFQDEYKASNYKNLTIDKDAFQVSVGNQKIQLTTREFNILSLLMDNPKKVFTKAILFEEIWNEKYIGDDNTINVHVSNLRNKISKINGEDPILTVWGIGYKLKE